MPADAARKGTGRKGAPGEPRFAHRVQSLGCKPRELAWRRAWSLVSLTRRRPERLKQSAKGRGAVHECPTAEPSGCVPPQAPYSPTPLLQAAVLSEYAII